MHVIMRLILMNNKNVYNKYPNITTTAKQYGQPFDINEFTKNMQASQEALDEFREHVTKAEDDIDNKIAMLFIRHGLIANVDEYKKICKTQYNYFTDRYEVQISNTIKEPQYKDLYNMLFKLKL